jgi:squalene-associated FAD-dependent desaturase
VVVIGGGLAGISAALAAADGGAEVVLVERRPRLGGLTWSFERGGLWFDNGQHVFLRCYSAYRTFLDRIGSTGDVAIQERMAIPVLRPRGRTSWIRRSALPAPLHLGPALARYSHLPVRERISAARASLALRKLEPHDRRLDDVTLGEWLALHNQKPAAIEALWDLIATPTLNLSASEASLALAVKVFRTGLLDRSDACDIGWSTVPLVDLHARRASRALEGAGVEVMLATRVEGLETRSKVDERRSSVVCTSTEGSENRLGELAVRTDRRLLEADAVVVAVPPGVAANLVGAEVLGEVGRLGSSAIVNVHLVLDRRITDLPMAAAIGSPVQFVFDRTVSSGLAGSEGSRGSQCLAISLSAADEYLRVKSKQLVARFIEALDELFPAMRGARVLDALVTREPAATFRGVPGTQELRPTTWTAVPGLFMAGAWCATGWPATMEGAVRSGVDAACHALGRPRTTERDRLQDATQALARTLSKVPLSSPTAVSLPAPRLRPPGEVATIQAIRDTSSMARCPRSDEAQVASSTRLEPSRAERKRVPASLERAAKLVTPALSEVISCLPRALRLPVEHHLAGGGKRVRAALVLLSAAACGAEESSALPGAVSIELVHNFSLLHDDIIDGDHERRHRPTVWAEFGIGPAIVAGDALAILALQHLLEDPTPERLRSASMLAEATQAMIAGQADDMAFETMSAVSLEDCLGMELRKTGALLSCAASLGAILSGAPEPKVAALAEYGAHVGIAFQAVDDMLGIWGDPSVTGKPVGSDLAGHKKTLPVVSAISETNAAAEELRSILDSSPDAPDVERVTRLIEDAGAREVVAEIADTHLQAALGVLVDAKFAPRSVAELGELALFITKRDR